MNPSLLASKGHCVPRVARNLISLPQHALYAASLTAGVHTLSQVKLIALEVSWTRLGADTAFSWWMLAFIAEIIGERRFICTIYHLDVPGLRLVYNLVILISASRRLPELWGYRYGCL